MSSHVVGIDIGGTKLATVVADKDGNVLQKVRKPTESERGPRHAVQLMLDMVDEVLQLARLSREDISGIGVSCGSQSSISRRSLRMMRTLAHLPKRDSGANVATIMSST